MSLLATNLMSGSAFGAALLASGVYRPRIIVDQFSLQHSYMLGVFLTASGISALSMAALQSMGWMKSAARTQSSFLSRPYLGNVVGGALVGLGMALSGACPGTVLVQVAVGMRSGRLALAGGVAGGWLYSILRRNDVPPVASVKKTTEGPTALVPPTLHDRFGLDPFAVLAGYDFMILAILCALPLMGYQPPIARTASIIRAGTYIGAAQFLSLLLRRKPVGVSGVYGDLGNRLSQLGKAAFGRSSNAGQGGAALFPFSESTYFAAGLMLGAAALARHQPAFVAASNEVAVSEARSLLGGVIMVLGARLGGGCTSGHGLSGMATFSLASIATTAAMFGFGILASTVLL